MYYIVEFDGTDKVEILPEEWIADDTLPQNILNKVVQYVEFYWPPYLASKITRSVKNRISAEVNWKLFRARILGWDENYGTARKMLTKSERACNLESDDDSTTREKPNQKYIVTSDEADDEDNESAAQLISENEFAFRDPTSPKSMSKAKKSHSGKCAIQQAAHGGRSSGSVTQQAAHDGRRSGSATQQAAHDGRSSGSATQQAAHDGRSCGSATQQAAHDGRSSGSATKQAPHAGRSSGSATQQAFQNFSSNSQSSTDLSDVCA